ncbi:12719_t:CDS:2, partial [Funneliformis caledonium]
SVKSNDLTFRKEKTVREGYDFNGCEEIDLIAKYLEMTAIPHDAYYFTIHKRLFTLQLEDFWDNNLNLFRYTDEESNDNNNSTISQNINYVVSKLSSQEKSDLSDLDIIVSIPLLEKNYKTCQVIVKHIQKLPDIL